MTRSRNYVVALLATAAGLLTASPAFAGSWQTSFAFGATLNGDLYTPTTLASSPAILVAIHMCSGHSSTVHGWFDSYADTNGFYIIAPSSGSNDCFDSSATRSGDRAAIVTMVNYLITNKHADKTRVFAAGMSSGGCMTNTLVAIYPDVFAGGSAMPGFPAGGWPAGDTTCTKCGSTPPNMTGAQWAAVATNAFKWSGQYGCSQQWVGGGDQYNFNGYLPSVVLQMQTLGSLGAATSEASWSDHSGWTRTVYKDSSGNVRLETNLGPSSQKHDLETVSPTLYKDVISFLGLDKPTGACGLSTTSTTGGGGAGGGTATGGATGTGGAAGAKGTGGSTTATGGTSGAAGAKGTGGSTTATGGTTGTGTGGNGATGTGGTTVTGTGGSATATGGTTGTGTGGNSATGTGGSETGGVSGEGGSTGTGGTETGGTTGGSGNSGCSCSVDAGRGQRGPLVILLGIAFAVAARRRRSRR
jgi:acetylxylan esterase